VILSFVPIVGTYYNVPISGTTSKKQKQHSKETNMDINVYALSDIADEKIDQLISNKQSFTLTGVSHMTKAVATLERQIENKGLKCRVYTKGRAATIGAAAIPVSPTVIGGWLAGAAIGLHNLATYDPDYELAKKPLSNELEINYKK